jgi:hypothetical protein
MCGVTHEWVFDTLAQPSSSGPNGAMQTLIKASSKDRLLHISDRVEPAGPTESPQKCTWGQHQDYYTIRLVEKG